MKSQKTFENVMFAALKSMSLIFVSNKGPFKLKAFHPWSFGAPTMPVNLFSICNNICNAGLSMKCNPNEFRYLVEGFELCRTKQD